MNKKIGHKGFASLLFFLSQEIFLGVGLTRILSISEQNSWISILIAFVIGFIFLNMIMYVMNYKKDLNVFEKIDISQQKKCYLQTKTQYIGQLQKRKYYQEYIMNNQNLTKKIL